MVSVVIPVLNGAKTIGRVVSGLLAMSEREGLELEIILVDDASQDDSAKVIEGLANQLQPVRAMKNETRQGQQETLLTGLAEASGDILVTMDDDMQHDPDEVPRLLAALGGGHDLVYGILTTVQTGVLRTWGSRSRDVLFHHLYPVLGENQVGSFRAFTRRLHQDATRQAVRFSYISCLHLRENPRVANVPMNAGASRRERSNYGLLSLIRLLVRIYWYYGPGARFNGRRDI